VNLPTAQFWPVSDYDLAATLECGQAFRWVRSGRGWESIVGGRWARVESAPGGLQVSWMGSDPESGWLRRHLAADEALEPILASFPDDPPLRAAVARCRGLRLLRQEPWECLASFICSSTKQIVQIRQIVAMMADGWGAEVAVPEGAVLRRAFPTPAALVAAGEPALRACKLGFRAPFLIDAARRLEDGRLNLEALAGLDTPAARAALMEIHGVGRKIADCVLLFAYGRQDAFPIDVWVRRALSRLYFPRARRLTAARLEAFSQGYFGPWAGYAQQYLFHYVRLEAGRGVEA
jgi:N-glycosylase/DNA lyase